MKEVSKFIKKAKSAPGNKRISYKLYKNCPEVIYRLYQLLQEVWENKLNPKEVFCLAASTCQRYMMQLELATSVQYPSSMLKAKYTLEILPTVSQTSLMVNKFIHTSVQKAGIPGFSGSR